jgi:hypothetical protein
MWPKYWSSWICILNNWAGKGDIVSNINKNNRSKDSNPGGPGGAFGPGGPGKPSGPFGPGGPGRPGGPLGPGGPGSPGGPGRLPMPTPGVDFLITKAVPRYPDMAYASLSPSQKLDLYLPKGSGPSPVVLLVHGGGFMFGDKADPVFKSGTDLLLARGYAVANINYRLSGEARAPAPIHDVKTAVRWLRAHASQYHLNPGGFVGHLPRCPGTGGHRTGLAK